MTRKGFPEQRPREAALRAGASRDSDSDSRSHLPIALVSTMADWFHLVRATPQRIRKVSRNVFRNHSTPVMMV